ncbi:MAG: D-alanyl-D-alanine carboxypeptidase [Nitrospira sp.]|nr:MAG: D-alanyl-D-alanine carboxypeptidase [Nitrospira sp.]
MNIVPRLFASFPPTVVWPAGLLVLALLVPSGAWAEIDQSTTTTLSPPATRGFAWNKGRRGAGGIPAHSILLKDLSTGQTLYEYQAQRRVPPASLTKIMSALVILEHGQLHEPATVSRKAAAAHKTHLRLKTGQAFRLEDLVKAMLIMSANDACLAAVEHVAGSEEGFVELMNVKAQALGLTDTHYANACGFDAPDHYSTATDLAMLTEVAMRHPTFRTFVRSKLEVISAINANRSYLLRNTNHLLGRIPGVEGVKTGFTSKAGRCLVAKVSHDGKELLLVLLNSSRRWTTASTLLYGALQIPSQPITQLE